MPPSATSLGAVVLAAGHGTRMRSARPKVLHPLAGRPMLDWVLTAVAGTRPADTVVVVAPDTSGLAEALPAGVTAAVQAEPDGTGGAAGVGLAALDPACETVLVLYGDTPLVTSDLIEAVIADHRRSGRAATLVSAVLSDPAAYGRVVRGADGGVARIVEAPDAGPGELAVQEVNAGVYVCDRLALAEALDGLGADNAQLERYLPDAVLRLGAVGAVVADDPRAVLGVNTRVELAACESVIQGRLREAFMLAGVTMPDPARVYLDAGVRVGEDTVLWPDVHLRGATTVGGGCEIGPNVVMIDSRSGEGSVVVNAHLVGAELGARCQVGPYASLRPGTRLADGAKAGTFVEMKNASIGAGAKVPHLSYVGDATVGEEANIGAGNITANYDGFRKHRTEIGARARTGSDCVFVAPVEVGDDAMTGAGSVITHDVPPGALGIARERQTNLEGYVDRARERARRTSEG
jgi:bifunctional UDP-N-acetylglucosamine pyrophosphorylase/glucosamine-1-phosphate N-acetyltransferase